ncbi:MAG: cytochrome c maturation protein CcmE [Armatimonadota bacterium]|nr:cytochrome c maturation protein CcmE [Armatimonadota bacterium]
MKKSYIIGALLIIGFIAFAAAGFIQSITPYVSIAEAKTADSQVQVKGALLKDRITIDKSGALNFFIKDEDGAELQVTYKGSKPGNFEQASHVVAVGTYHNGAFRADRLIVKCPSKYQGEVSGSK